MRYWERPEFKVLQAAWYQRLAEDGFADAEELIAGEMLLKATAEKPYRGADQTTRQAKESYYLELSHRLERDGADNEIDHLILSLYAQGAKIQAIAETLRYMPPRRPPAFVSELARSTKTVLYRIRIYETRWGLRQHDDRYFENYKRYRKEAG